MKPAAALAPEFYFVRLHAEAGPAGRSRDGGDSELSGILRQSFDKGPVSIQRFALKGSPGADLRQARPRDPVSIRFLRRDRLRRSLNTDLAFEGIPVKGERGARDSR